jgi:Ca2+-binding EF-hand superfamily protein
MKEDLNAIARQLRPAIPGYSLIDLKSSFAQIDVDQDGFITSAELKTLFIKLNEPLSDAECLEMIRLYDSDGDGRISFKDWLSLLTMQPGDFTTELAEETRKFLDEQLALERVAGIEGLEAAGRLKQARLEQAAESATTTAVTGNAAVDLGNFMRSLAGPEGLTPSFMRRMVEAFRVNDMDGSGELDFNEFCRLINKPNDDPLALTAFATFDADRSGAIALRELLLGLSAFAVATVEEKVAFAFRLFDERQTDRLDRSTLAHVINANFVAQGGLAEIILQRRVEAVYRLAGVEDDNISFEQYMYVARTNAGLLFPAYQSLR